MNKLRKNTSLCVYHYLLGLFLHKVNFSQNPIRNKLTFLINQQDQFTKDDITVDSYLFMIL